MSKSTTARPSLRDTVREAMDELHHNAESLATETGGIVSRSQIYRWLGGECDITIERAEAILAALGLRLVVEPDSP